MEGVEEVDVVGEITAGGSATKGLRRLVKKDEEEEEEEGVSEVQKDKVDVEEAEPPDSKLCFPILSYAGRKWNRSGC